MMGRLPLHALILAAGRGSRFGGDKLHALYRGRPLLAYVLDVVAAARERGLLDGGYVVVGAGDARASALSQGAHLETITNPAPELGLSHSVQLGLAALEARSIDAALILLGDQPLVRLEVIEALVAKWRDEAGPIIRPRYEANPDTPGHPVLLARSIWPAARQLEGDYGLGSLFNSTRPEVVTLNVPGANPDVDTTADLLGLKELPR